MIVQEAAQFSVDKNDEESNNKQKKHIFDEDDDTSRQATQNYDLNDNEQEVRNFDFLFLSLFINSLFSFFVNN